MILKTLFMLLTASALELHHLQYRNIYIPENYSFTVATETQGVTISIKNETSNTSISGIYTRGNYAFANWGTNRIKTGTGLLLFNVLSPGEIKTFPLPRGTYDICVETSNTSGKKTTYKSIMWDNKKINNSRSFIIDREAWSFMLQDNIYWANLPCNKR